MKKAIVITSLIFALGLSGTAAQAKDGNDLVVWNNGDGSDFMESINARFWRFFGYR
ncbi:hypothetical protein [Parasphingorhabdus sp.]|uniref:hypothetical protein n=1 Tax=Parasphingorhabdus sp. TaxID=2709688 RepID=UPI003266247D